MSIGLGLIGVALFNVGGNEASIAVIGAVVSEFISGTALTMYYKNFNRLNQTSKELRTGDQITA